MLVGNRFKICLACVLCGFAILSVYLFVTTSSFRFFVVVSESMKPNLNTGDIVIINPNIDQTSTFTDLKIGDIIAFAEHRENSAGRNKIVVHRVLQIDDGPDGDRIIKTKGDANPYPIQFVDFPITKEEFVGKVDYSVPYLGLVLIYIDTFIRVIIPPVLYILGAVAVGVFIALRIRRR